ncbi:hypothetical protein B0H21DRAFT_761094 [Amylocystis lapponica]|nr:hypothetical protein B0H21DRAFT_761094 [Amylocystis lapponica]
MQSHNAPQPSVWTHDLRTQLLLVLLLLSRMPTEDGLDSGYVFVPGDAVSGFPTWNLTITDDTEPIWFFCAQGTPVNHCALGMVVVPSSAMGGASANTPPASFSGSTTPFTLSTSSLSLQTTSTSAAAGVNGLAVLFMAVLVSVALMRVFA